MKRGLVLGLFLTLSIVSGAADTSKAGGARPPISKDTRMELIRLMNAEYAWVKVPLPRAEKGITIKPDGRIDPAGRDMQLAIAKFGPLARPGERVQVTSIDIKDRQVLLELNGGFAKKAKWYQRIQVGANGGTTNVAPGPDNSRAKGTSIIVEFKNHVPEMNMAELKQILSPLLDFTVKSSAQAYTESLPKNVQQAIKDHRVLVGMNKDMVTYAKGRPPQRVREKDPNGVDYEEWIYGMPPADTEFVRFTGEEVTQLKIMKVDGQKVVKTQREVTLDEPAIAMARANVGNESADACSVPTVPNPTGPDGSPRTNPDGTPATNPDGTPATDPNGPARRYPSPTIQRRNCQENTSATPQPPAPGGKRPTLRRPGEAVPDNQGDPIRKTSPAPTDPSAAPPGDIPDGTPRG
jgi:hypothetical protein